MGKLTISKDTRTSSKLAEEEFQSSDGLQKLKFMDSEEYFWFDRSKVLGIGCSASVYECHSVENDKLAVKVFDVAEECNYVAARLEIKLLQKINHKHIVKFVGQQWIGNKAYLVMERAEGMPLSSFLKSGQALDCHLLAVQLLEAVAYLHQEGIAHRDLKPDNIIVTGNSLKLIDFNTASLDVVDYTDCIKGGTGLKEWSAPETRQKLFYSAKCDSYSCGLIIAAL